MERVSDYTQEHSHIYDVVLVGSGPSNISCANYLKHIGIDDFLIFDTGKNITSRNHNSSLDCVHGVGGAGIFSDGKFSFCPAGTYVWEKFNSSELNESYAHLEKMFEGFISVPKLIQTQNEKNDDMSEWHLKDYESVYLDLDKRIKLTQKITSGFNDRIVTTANVVRIEKNANYYIIKWILLNDTNKFDNINVNVNANKSYRYTKAKHIVMGGGRFMPLFIKNNVKIIPTEFVRVEIGIRVEGPSTHSIFNVSKNTDPKYIRELSQEDMIEAKLPELAQQNLIQDKNKVKTFCWCRNGECVETSFYFDPINQTHIKTWSGRADIEPNGSTLSNFGFNIVLRNPKSFELVSDIIGKESWIIPAEQSDILEENDNNDINMYSKIIKLAQTQLKKFADYHNIDLKDLNMRGPTLEGVGFYPITTNELQVPNELIWITGDASGKFRGIIPSMISGIYAGCQIAKSKNIFKINTLSEKSELPTELKLSTELKLPTELINQTKIILISGKRYAGKGEVSKIFKRYYEEIGKKVCMVSFSYLLKVNFCHSNQLDLERFINDHKYKDTYRNELTEYFMKTDPVIYAQYLEQEIKLNKYDVYIVDDLRLRSHIDYMNTHLKTNSMYDVKYIRVNARDDSKNKRGWVKIAYDDTIYETELDTWDKFDYILTNDADLTELENQVRTIFC